MSRGVSPAGSMNVDQFSKKGRIYFLLQYLISPRGRLLLNLFKFKEFADYGGCELVAVLTNRLAQFPEAGFQQLVQLLYTRHAGGAAGDGETQLVDVADHGEVQAHTV
jgi:hypothetical protein